ncbi:ABC transporter ATP-binding protein [Clostridium facile]|uniref:ABC transporter ATP-binding protein n=1 Tax=Clostridium facile TaxID=2763035 RepID=A0ABR7IQF3_9CLOT|nr:ABC transporter ATP-binding protein [Clostridium facile]MBC5787361.1 ABC transporter ATP-binding protein [Clostridium facile]
MAVIEVNGITKDYGQGRGIFDLSFSIQKGEVFGFLGPNGAGKTTTLRHLMGFIHPDQGQVMINGKDCFSQSAEIHKTLGYLPGEIAFPEDMTGRELIRFMSQMRGMDGVGEAEKLAKQLEFDDTARIRRMSKGTKQKLGIICAFMHRPEVLLLDEPTSGLDPLMQNRFLELVNEQKSAGRTVFMSSHSFEEIERTCTRAAILRAGRLVTVENIQKLRSTRRKTFVVQLKDEPSAIALSQEITGTIRKRDTVTVSVTGDIDSFLKKIASYPVRDLQQSIQTLEEVFLYYYGGKTK